LSLLPYPLLGDISSLRHGKKEGKKTAKERKNAKNGIYRDGRIVEENKSEKARWLVS